MVDVIIASDDFGIEESKRTKSNPNLPSVVSSEYHLANSPEKKFHCKKAVTKINAATTTFLASVTHAVMLLRVCSRDECM